MKRYLIACLVVLALLVPGSPGGASAEADTSPNVNLLTKIHPQGAIGHLAFKDNLMFVQMTGTSLVNDQGFVVYRLLKKAPYLREISRFVCPGADHLGGISVWGDLLMQSVSRHSAADQPPSTAQCNNTDDSRGKVGLRIVDISNPRRPRQVAFVETTCGSASNTLIPKNGRLYAYIPTNQSHDPGCSDEFAAPAFQLEVIKVDPKDPSKSAVVNTPRVGQPGGCHGIWAFVPRNVAVCTITGQSTSLQVELLDISDPADPKTLSWIRNPTYASTVVPGASFTWDGRYLALTIATNPSLYPLTCATEGEASMGLVKLYDIEDPANPVEVTRHTIDRSNLDQGEGCYPSVPSFIPFRNRDRMVATIPWTANGLTIVDFSDPSSPREIGHYYGQDANLRLAVWHNGRIYMFDQEIAHEPNHGTGLKDPAVVVVEMDGTKRSTTSWFKGAHNHRTQVPATLR